MALFSEKCRLVILMRCDCKCRFGSQGNGNPLHYSCVENSMDGGAWWVTVHGVAKSRAWLSNFTSSLHFSIAAVIEAFILGELFKKQDLMKAWSHNPEGCPFFLGEFLEEKDSRREEQYSHVARIRKRGRKGRELASQGCFYCFMWMIIERWKFVKSTFQYNIHHPLVIS